MKRCLSIVLAVLVPITAVAGPRHRDKKKPAPVEAPAPAPEPAPAPPPPPPAEVTPWSQGVPLDRQQQANVIFDEANQLFATQAHAAALEKYRAALALWDHPLIRFNAAVTLIRLERILDAAGELESALRYGDEPFKPELYQQALDYQALVKGRVGDVEVTCKQAGTTILLDGKQWLACPGTKRERVLAGEHTVVGEQKGFLPRSTRLVVAGGSTAKTEVALERLDANVKVVYPYRRWIPWTATATGAAIALSGVAVWFLGKNQMKDFESNFARDCANGCEPDLSEHSALKSQRDSASLKGKVGIGMMIGGGAVALTGTVFVLLNRPKRVLPNLEVLPTNGGMTATTSWRF